MMGEGDIAANLNLVYFSEPVLSTFAEQFVFRLAPSAESGCGGLYYVKQKCKFTSILVQKR